MSEIKFRAWDKIKKKMVDLANMNFDPTGPLTHIILWDDDDNCYDLGVGSFKLMQYTGLKDKNGVDIYEGDVVEWNDGSKGKPPIIRRAIVRIDPDILYMLTPNTPTGQPMHIFHHGCFSYSATHLHLNVIGNIYENPELARA